MKTSRGAAALRGIVSSDALPLFVLLAVAPGFVFLGRGRIALLLAPTILWAMRAAGKPAANRRTSIDGALAFLLVWIFLGSMAAPGISSSEAKLSGLIYSVLLFFALVLATPRPGRLRLAVAAFVYVGSMGVWLAVGFTALLAVGRRRVLQALACLGVVAAYLLILAGLGRMGFAVGRSELPPWMIASMRGAGRQSGCLLLDFHRPYDFVLSLRTGSGFASGTSFGEPGVRLAGVRFALRPPRDSFRVSGEPRDGARGLRGAPPVETIVSAERHRVWKRRVP